MEPRRPGDGVPGVAVTASTPAPYRGLVRAFEHARVPEIEKFYAGVVAEDERRDAGEREDFPGHGLGLEHGLLGRRFGGDRAVGGGHICMPAQLMAQSIC